MSIGKLDVGDTLQFRNFSLLVQVRVPGHYYFKPCLVEKSGIVIHLSLDYFQSVIEQTMPLEMFRDNLMYGNGQYSEEMGKITISLPSDLNSAEWIFDSFGTGEVFSDIKVEEKEDRTLFTIGNVILEARGKPKYELL